MIAQVPSNTIGTCFVELFQWHSIQFLRGVSDGSGEGYRLVDLSGGADAPMCGVVSRVQSQGA